MGLKCSKPKPSLKDPMSTSLKDPMSLNDPVSLKDPMSLSFKDLILTESFKHGKLLLGKECFATTDPCEHDNCLYITSKLDMIELGRLDASTINKALKTGIYVEYNECKNVSVDEIIEHFRI